MIGFTPTGKGAGNVAIVTGRHAFPQSVNVENVGPTGATSLISAGADDDDLAAGGALAFGDLNADGLTDIILGAPAADGHSDAKPGCGEVYIIFGRATFPTSFTMALDVLQGPSILLSGRSPGDALSLGGALYVADLNGDGKDDLVAGSPYGRGTGSSQSKMGEAHIFLGKSNYQSGMVADLNGEVATPIYGPQANANLTSGGKITSGDVNGDGIQDLLISAPLANGIQPAIPGAGLIFTILGRAVFPQTVRLDAPAALVTPSFSGPDFVIQGMDGTEGGNHLTDTGILKTADVNGDGVADIICGSHNAANPLSGDQAAGQVYILFGRKSPATFPVLLRLTDDNLTDAGVTINGAFGGNHLARGGALTSGDVDGDGYTDIVIGSDTAAAFGSGGRIGAGHAYLIKGRPHFQATINLRQEGDSHDGADMHLRGAAVGDALTSGGSLTLADINADGDLDIILGAPLADAAGDSRADAGEVYVVQGKRRGLLALYAPDGTLVTKDSIVNLGEVGLGDEVPFPFILKNPGKSPLAIQGLQSIHGPDITFVHVLSTFGNRVIQPGESVPIDFFLRPEKLGDRQTAFLIDSSGYPSDHSALLFTLKAKVVKATPAGVKTLAAIPGITTALLKGQVTVNGKSRRVFFDYGLTSNFDNTVEVLPSAAADAPANTAVQATVTGLLPHSRYYFRVRATSAEGSARGATVTLLTGNRSPVAVNDTVSVTNSAIVTLPLQVNDTDADGDALSVATFTQPKADGKAVGKLAKVGDNLVFTAPANFAALAALETTFTYTVKDAFGGTSDPATVVLTPGPAELASSEIEVTSAGGEQFVQVTTDALWSIQEVAPWVTTVASSYGVAVLNVQPNPFKAERRAIVTIAGLPYTIIQAGVLKPTIALPAEAILPTRVAAYFELPILTENFPVTYAVAQLPPGLTINQATGIISGYPTKDGTYPVTVRAANAAGAATAVLAFDIQVGKLNTGFVGSHLGFIKNTDLSAGNQGARLELTVSSTGAVTGKVVTGLATYPFTSRLVGTTVEDQPAAIDVNIIPADKQPRSLSIILDPASSTGYGGLVTLGTQQPLKLWRHTWTVSNPVPAAVRGLHTFAATVIHVNGGEPDGYAYGSFTLQTSTGSMTVTGKLPDGSVFTTAGFMGAQGQILFYQPLYAQKGLFGGVASVALPPIDPSGSGLSSMVSFEPIWFDPGSPASARDTLYPNGFGPSPLFLFGGRFPTLDPGALLIGNPDLVGANARISFNGADSQDLSIRNMTPKGLTHKATPVAPVSLTAFSLPVLNAVTGAFSGSYTIPGTSAALTRRIAFQGQIVRSQGIVQGYGYFHLPELPSASGQTIATTPKLSLAVELISLTP